jgi:hypothetical protein
MKINDTINSWVRTFLREIFIIHKKVLAITMLLVGIPLLWLSLGWLLQDENDKSHLLILGNITRYDVEGTPPNESVEIKVKPSNIKNDSLINKFYYFKYKETFQRDRFEKMGGGLGAWVELKIDSLELSYYGLELHSLRFKGEEFININLRNKLKRENQWAAFIAAVLALSISFGLFKLIRMIKFN